MSVFKLHVDISELHFNNTEKENCLGVIIKHTLDKMYLFTIIYEQVILLT